MQWCIVFSFSFAAEYSRFLSVRTAKNLKDWGQQIVELYLDN